MRTTISGAAQKYKRWIRKGGFGLALILAGYALGFYASSHTWGHRSITVVHAQAAPPYATTYVKMPKTWGPLIATMNGVLVFQDRAGAIRLVAANTGAVGEVITRE